MTKPAIAVTVKETAATKQAIKRLSIMKATPEMRRAMMQATAPAVPALRSAIRSMPSKHESTQKPTLTESLAKNAGRRSKLHGNTVMVMVLIKGGGLANLARAVEGSIPWVHPTFDREPIVEQTPYPFFTETMAKIQALVSLRMRQAQIKIRKNI